MGIVTLPNTLVDHTVPTAAQFMANFNTIYNEFNGLIDNANIAADADIAESKLLFDTTNGHKHDGSDSKLIQVNRAFPFFVPGTPSVANDLSWNPTSPEAVTAVKGWVHVKTAPTGADLIIRIYNVTQSRDVCSITVAAGAIDGNNSSMTNAAIAAGDVLRCDVTQIGSTVAGANATVVLECSQP
jgi:hypothetical protein